MAYVLMCSIKPQVAEKHLLSVVKKYVGTMLENGCIVRDVKNNGLRTMAYDMHKKGDPTYYEKSHMVSIEFFSPPNALAALTKELSTDERLLRYTTLKANETLPRIPYSERVGRMVKK